MNNITYYRAINEEVRINSLKKKKELIQEYFLSFPLLPIGIVFKAKLL